MGISFVGMEEEVEALFKEIERRRGFNQERGRSPVRHPGRRGEREVRNLESSINYEGSVLGRGKSKRRWLEGGSEDGFKIDRLHNEIEYPIMEHQGLKE